MPSATCVCHAELGRPLASRGRKAGVSFMISGDFLGLALKSYGAGTFGGSKHKGPQAQGVGGILLWAGLGDSLQAAGWSALLSPRWAALSRQQEFCIDQRGRAEGPVQVCWRWDFHPPLPPARSSHHWLPGFSGLWPRLELHQGTLGLRRADCLPCTCVRATPRFGCEVSQCSRVNAGLFGGKVDLAMKAVTAAAMELVVSSGRGRLCWCSPMASGDF